MPALALGRPETGFGHYLRDVVYGGLDGVVTTLAVVAGAEGASLGLRVAWILGLANLAADGLSMAASNYLGLKSQLQQEGRSVAAERPLRHGAATYGAFVVAGSVPLLALLLPSGVRLVGVALLSAVALFALGASRARFLAGRTVAGTGFEMTVIGLGAAGVAFAVGAGARMLL